MMVLTLDAYHKLISFLREHVAPISAVVAILAGAVAIYTNARSLDMMLKQLDQIDAGQYQQYQGSIALAWRTIGEANGKRFEVGQSTSLYYLAVNSELSGNVTLNNSSLNLTPPRARVVSAGHDPRYVTFDLSKSSLCGTEISKFSSTTNGSRRTAFTQAFMRTGAMYGSYVSDDFLAADMQELRFVNVKAENARFAAADLRRSVFVGGLFSDADFQGVDLREARTERGILGFGVTGYDSYSYDVFIDDPSQRTVWPALFDPGLGINDVMAATGQRSSSEGASYPVDFSKANFTGADLRGAQLQNSNISQAQINQACVDATTVLPEGRSAAKPCEFPMLFAEKLAVLRGPVKRNPLERACATALQTPE
ncbi:pentapeptide repeat-containing protein [Bradyrhizobium oligotrophicum S58]|uniref:Pentapeptide repeat-containing protein n=2 Tax=Bradyrhizobium oligotrophicum TaxID=44255 RepID=M4ZGT9_9BRAD|nr:pentapeptide repeat-containing protein [Bradyrhizobium oligotrophicum S58]